MFGRDRICAVVAAPDAKSMWRQLARALRSTRTIEIRLDWLANDAKIARFLRTLTDKKPRATLIATCRRQSAGGRYRGTVAQQLVQLAQALRAGCTWYDFDLEAMPVCPPKLKQVLLGAGQELASAHYFKSAPKNLKKIVADASRAGAAAVKIAAQCDSLAAGIRLLGVARQRRDIVAIPMGEAVQPLRVLALRQGSALTYAPVSNATAAGQISLETMTDLFRAAQVDRRTGVYGVIGDPVGHSLSPLMQNAAFRKRRMNAVYLPFLVSDLRDFLAAIGPLGIKGFSITLPHKESILRHLDGCDPLAAAIGAVNTVVVRAGGKLYGYNTDYVGVLRALERRIPLRGSRVLIVGAGGAARAVAFALAQAAASVCICARRPARAKALAKAVGGETIARGRLKKEFFDAIVNATPVGMHPNIQQSPLEARELNCRLVFDTIYRPRQTKLLQLAAWHRIETISGVEMFIAQGAAQWEIWTGQRAPMEAMRRAVLQSLTREEKPRTHS